MRSPVKRRTEGRIDIVPEWATVHDFQTRIPRTVEDLARQKFDPQAT